MIESITTIDELHRWIEEIPERHQQQGDFCKCGWSAQFATWEEHMKGGPVHDLADFVPSRTSGSDGQVMCGHLEDDLYGTIDSLHEVLNAYDAYMRGELSHPEAQEIVAAALPGCSVPEIAPR